MYFYTPLLGGGATIGSVLPESMAASPVQASYTGLGATGPQVPTPKSCPSVTQNHDWPKRRTQEPHIFTEFTTKKAFVHPNGHVTLLQI